MAGHVAEVPVSDDRCARVAERGQQHLRGGPRVVGRRHRVPGGARRRPGRRAARPSARRRPAGGRRPARPRITAAIGTVATSRPGGGAGQRPLGVREQDPRQRRSPGRRTRAPPASGRAGPAGRRERSAKGRSSRAPSAVRTKTTVTGVTSVTATLMSRYGMPQMTPTATRRIQPRRLIEATERRSTDAPGHRHGSHRSRTDLRQDHPFTVRTTPRPGDWAWARRTAFGAARQCCRTSGPADEAERAADAASAVAVGTADVGRRLAATHVVGADQRASRRSSSHCVGLVPVRARKCRVKVRRDIAARSAHRSRSIGSSSRAAAHAMAVSSGSGTGGGATGDGMNCACDPSRCGARTRERAIAGGARSPRGRCAARAGSSRARRRRRPR